MDATRKFLYFFALTFAISPVLAIAEPVANGASGYAPDLQKVVDQVSPAVVRIEFSGKRIRTGVIISADGVIATANNGRKILDKGERVSVHLADGRHVKATRLGWSGEWRIELLKIQHGSQDNWPHVNIDHDAKVAVGQSCVLLGHSGDDDVGNTSLAVRTGSIEQSAYPYWCATSADKNATFGGGLFDHSGNFLGITTRTRRPSHTCIGFLLNHRSDLKKGLNLDRQRLAAGESDYPALQREHVAELIRSTTVRVQHNEKQNSGVVISGDGLVITCAHGTHKNPGEEVSVTFSEGKESSGRIINSNPVSDLALIQLDGSGPWKHATWGSSVGMHAGGRCLVSGYPHGHSGVEPVVKETQVSEPADLEWSHLLWTSDYGLQGGESGGGIFDTEGRLIGIIHGFRVAPKPRAAFHARVEMVRRQLPLLRTPSLE